MKKFSLIFSLVFFVVGFSMAQRTVSGTIADQDGEPLIGASVFVKGTTTGTVTDFEGMYKVEVPADGKVLVFSYTGFQSQDIELGASNQIDVKLLEGAMLGEVVVTASGIERNSRDVAYANQTVTSEDLLSTPSKNTLEALRGKAAGVKLSTGSGSVGASTRIVLRGEGSLTGNNNALIVVDGIPIDNSSSKGGATATATSGSESGYADHGNRFNDLNPDDIASVTILKGPSATSLYGSRGASGVILITTKKGGEDGSLKIGLNSTYSREEAYILLQRQDQFGQGYGNAHFDSGENWSWGPAFDGVVRPWTSPVDADGDGALESLTRPYSNVNDQLQEFFNIGSTLSNSFYVSGANNGFTYYASYSNTSQDGILENTSYDRNTVTFNASAKLSDRLTSNFKVSYANVNQNTAQEGARAFDGNNAYSMAVQSPVNIPLSELRDYNNPFHSTLGGYWGSYSSVNPYFILNEYGNESNINNFLGSANVTYQVADGLSLIGTFGANIISTDIDTWTPSFAPKQQLVWGDDLALGTRNGQYESLGDYTDYSLVSKNLDFSVLANYTNQLSDDLTLDVTAGYNWFQKETNRLTGTTVGGLVVNGWYNLSNSVQAAQSSQYSSLYRIYGALGNARLGYKNSLFLEYSARNDWSSTLPAANNSFFYQAVGLSAVLTDLLDVQSDALSFVKLRTSYGTSGKDAGLYLLNSSYIGNPNIVNLGDFTINYPLNGQAGFTTSNVIGNPDLKPELTTTLEVGADVGLFNDRVNIAYTYYSSSHSDQIVQVSLPRSSGFTQTASNIGEMTNKGHELTLNVKPLDGVVKGLKWDIFGAYSKNINEVVKITDEISELVVYGPFRDVSIVAKEGLPFGTFKAVVAQTNDAGQTIVDPVTGFPLYEDDEALLGSYQPDYTLSFGTNINYKGIGFNILFDVKQGGTFYSLTKFAADFNGTTVNTTEFNREEYVYPNSVYEDADGNFVANDILITEEAFYTDYDQPSANYLIDASYVKLREVSLSYQLPAKLMSSLPISNVKVSLFGKNLKFWLPDGNTFADPEINGPSLTGNASGIETTQTPTAKSVGVNLNITF